MTSDVTSKVDAPEQAGEREKRFVVTKRFYESLKKSEFIAPEKLAIYQESIVRSTIAHAIKQVPFYRRRLSMLVNADGDIDLARWLDVPVMTKSDLEADYHALLADQLPNNQGHRVTARSSGTGGGRMLATRRSQLADMAIACVSYRQGDAFNFDWSKHLVMIRGIDTTVAGDRWRENPERSTWGPPWLEPATRGARSHASLHDAPADLIEKLHRHAPAYVNTTPSTAMRLANYLAEAKTIPPAIAAILTVGETVTEDLRHECRTHLGCEVFDVYSTSECGVLACQCPDGSYHMQSELAVVEVLKDDGRPCRPGETGRITATPLYNFAMPLIRYQLDDYATVGEACSCGRSAPSLSRILGAGAQLFQFPDGSLHRPELSSELIRDFIGYQRWQLVQTANGRAEIRISRPKDRSALNVVGLRNCVSDLLGGLFNVESRYVPVIAPGPGGKLPQTFRECPLNLRAADL